MRHIARLAATSVANATEGAAFGVHTTLPPVVLTVIVLCSTLALLFVLLGWFSKESRESRGTVAAPPQVKSSDVPLNAVPLNPYLRGDAASSTSLRQAPASVVTLRETQMGIASGITGTGKEVSTVPLIGQQPSKFSRTEAAEVSSVQFVPWAAPTRMDISNAAFTETVARPGTFQMKAGELPPLCPRLILPMCEVRFTVPTCRITEAPDGEFDILGRSSNPLLRASLHTDSMSGRRSLSLHVAQAANLGDTQPLVTVAPPPQLQRFGAEAQPGVHLIGLEIRNGEGLLYGVIHRKHGASSYYVAQGHRTVMSINSNTHELLNFTVTAPTGQLLASMVPSSAPELSAENVEFRVKAGMDAVLVLSSVLGALTCFR